MFSGCCTQAYISQPDQRDLLRLHILVTRRKQVFRVKKLVGRRGAPELELLAVVIVLFAPILHESLTNSNFVTNTI